MRTIKLILTIAMLAPSLANAQKNVVVNSVNQKGGITTAVINNVNDQVEDSTWKFRNEIERDVFGVLIDSAGYVKVKRSNLISTQYEYQKDGYTAEMKTRNRKVFVDGKETDVLMILYKND